MRLRIISIWVVFVFAGLLPQLAKAQVAASNPLEWAAWPRETNDKRPDRQTNQRADTDRPDAEQYRSGVQPHT